MARNVMYPEGSEQMNVIVPAPVKSQLQDMASTRRLSVSQMVTVILEDWLRQNTKEPVGAA